VSAFLEVAGLAKRWAHTVQIGPVALGIARGEILALLGPSGSGKTTVLRLLAGFEAADAGRIVVEGEDVTAVPPARRRFGMVFQHYALFPHLDVGENVAFGLVRSAVRGAVAAKVAEALALVDLGGFERRKVQELSGGQQQRVALARALAPEPRVLLLDEPLSNLDPALRERTRRELRQLIQRVGITTVFVTHEQEEAFDLGDRVAVLNAGRLEQTGPADELYERPASLFVATFVGRANVFRGPAARALGGQNGEAIVVRPERLRFSDAGLPGIVRARRYTGPAAFFLVEGEDGTRFEVLAEPGAARVGERVYVEALRTVGFPEGGP
jgi:ABC-type Fe3+/spermidine/putrescine transport system ATPase subunit